MVQSINKPELSKNYKVRIGEFDISKISYYNPHGMTFNNRDIKGMIRGVRIYYKDKSLHKNTDFEKSMKLNILVLQALGINEGDYDKIWENKDVKYLGVLMNSNDNQSEVDKLKTLAHEIEFHLKNDLQYYKTGNKEFSKTPEEEHIEAYTKEFYDMNNLNPRYSSSKKDVPSDSKAGKLFEKYGKLKEQLNKEMYISYFPLGKIKRIVHMLRNLIQIKLGIMASY